MWIRDAEAIAGLLSFIRTLQCTLQMYALYSDVSTVTQCIFSDFIAVLQMYALFWVCERTVTEAVGGDDE